MKASEALIAWTPNTDHYADDPMRGQVKIGPLLREGDQDWTRPYACTGGAAHVDRRKMDKWTSIAFVFIDFQSIVVSYGVDPKVAHEAFLAIDEYRQRIPFDQPGAEEIPEGKEK